MGHRDVIELPRQGKPAAIDPIAPAMEDSIQLIRRGSADYRRLAAALVLAGFSTFALLYDVQPLLPLFAKYFSVGAAASSLVVSFATGAMALAFLPAGVVSDRVGRRPVMLVSLTASAAVTIISALLPGWPALLSMRAIVGVVLAGVPSVAMAYVAEEVEPQSVGSAMGIYVAGTAIGGMTGRLGMTVVADVAGWRLALGAMGAAGLLAALAFAALAPRSRAFVATRHDLDRLIRSTRRLIADRTLRLLYAEGFLLMGAFVTIYNYVGFRLQAPPFSLSQTTVGFIFLLYLIGSFSSAWFGGLAGRVDRSTIFWMPIATLLLGVAVTCANDLPIIILGIALVTGAFFAAHSTASGWVGGQAAGDRALAAALYLLCYYLGSSVLGAIGGIAWSRAAWPGVAGYTGALVLLALWVAVRLGLDRSGRHVTGEAERRACRNPGPKAGLPE